MSARVVLLLALLGLAAVWGAALAWPKPPQPLPEEIRGEWLVLVERIAEGSEAAPLPPGQERRFVFREDGSYLLSIRLPGGGEMLRREGLAAWDDGRLTLQLVSENRRATPADPDRFLIRWESVEGATHLVLAHDDMTGYEIHLRRP